MIGKSQQNRIELVTRPALKIRMDLVSNLREEGVRHFIVDVGSVFLDNFFDQAMKAGIVHTGNSFLTATLVSYTCCTS